MPITTPKRSALTRLWEKLSKRHRIRLLQLLGLMLIAASAETISVGAVFPLLTILVDPKQIINHKLMQPYLSELGVSSGEQLLFPITFIFCVAAFVAGSLRIMLVWTQAKISYEVGADIAVEVYQKVLHQEYSVHVARNSSDILNDVYNKASGISSLILLPMMSIVSSTMLLTAILSVPLLIDFRTTILAIVGFALIYGAIIKLTQRRLMTNSRIVATQAGLVIKALQEGLGGIRDVLIDGSQNFYCDWFREADSAMRKAQVQSTMIAQSPRLAIETLGMVLIALLAYHLALSHGNLASSLPFLGALALGAQRILPVAQLSFQSWATIRSNHASLIDTLELLDHPLLKHVDKSLIKSVPFNEDIRLVDVSFRYGENLPWVLQNISLKIQKGSRIGFIGPTGCGKSTLIDVIMGLLPPTTGAILIDGRPLTPQDVPGWHANIAHVPQSVFLSDSSIESNIAFGIPKHEINHSRIRSAAQQAQILEAIDALPEGFQERAGERGGRLSGGQRQRLGIARALYKEASVLFFDEATSALDYETEGAVTDAIQKLGPEMTVLIIAHRLDSLNCCDAIVEMANGRIVRTGSAQQLLARK